MREVLNCSTGCHVGYKNEKFTKEFNFRDTFSKKKDGSYYVPHKQKNPNKNTSNYRVHKTSLEPYNKCNNDVISYIVKTPEKWFILAAKFVLIDKFDKDWRVIGFPPQFSTWTRTNKNSALKERNEYVKGFNLFHDFIALENYDRYMHIVYPNKLSAVRDKHTKEQDKRIQEYEKIKKYLEQDKKAKELEIENQDSYLENKKQEHPISNSDPPSEIIFVNDDGIIWD